MKKEDVLYDYILHKRVSVSSENKLKDIRFYIGKFLDCVKDINKAEEKDLIIYLNSLNDYSVRTQNDIKAFLKHFIKWKYTDYSIRFRNLDSLCRSKKPPKVYQPEQMLNEKDIQKLVQSEHNLTWKTYFLLFFYSGCRPCEICNLTWDNITFEKEGAFLKIYSQKNKEHFNKFIPEDVSFYLKKIQNNKSKWVFPSAFINVRKDLPISEKSVYSRLKTLSLNVLGKRINPYIFRHSVATILYNRDDLKDDDVAQQMGHTKEMKQTYLNLSTEQLKKRMRKIWIKAEDLPEERKHELEKEIKDLHHKVDSLKRFTYEQLDFLFKHSDKQTRLKYLDWVQNHQKKTS